MQSETDKNLIKKSDFNRLSRFTAGGLEERMGKEMKQYYKGIVFLCVLVMSFLMISTTSFGAGTKEKLTDIITLEKNKDYEYDLNGDGIMEKLRFTAVENETDFTVAFRLYVNDKLCMKKTNHGFDYTVQLMDLDQSDNNLNIYGYSRMESDCVGYSFFAKYDEVNQFTYQKFDPMKLAAPFQSPRYSIEKVKGNGEFYLGMDTPVYSNAIGCYYCYAKFQLKKDEISFLPTKTYALKKFSKEYQYTAAKAFSVFQKAGSNTVAFHIKKGEKVTFDQLYLSKSGKVYFRLVKGSGATGWISSDWENLFEMTPAWG